MITLQNKMVNARDLHTQLESKKDFSTWIREKIMQAMLDEGKDFSPIKGKSTGGRPTLDYMLTVEAAKEICLLQQTPQGHSIRKQLIELSTQVEQQKVFNLQKMVLMVNLLNFYKYGEHQIEAEEQHKDRFKLTFKAKENIHKAFGEYRNDLLNIDNRQLKEAMIEAFNKGLIHKATAKNIRGRIALLDRYTLLRNAIVDYLISTGVNTHDALNFADTVKEVAIQTGTEIKIKNEDTLFNEREELTKPKLLSKNILLIN